MSELTIVHSNALSPLVEQLPPVGRISLSEIDSPSMSRLMKDPDSDYLRRHFHRFCIPNDVDLLNAKAEQQNDAISHFEHGYLPKDAHTAFASALIRKVHEVYRAKEFGGPDFNLYFHSTLRVLQGGPLMPIPSCLADISGLGFSTFGPSLMGRTSLIRAISQFMGPAFQVEGEHPMPRSMWIMPTLVLTYPSCRTLKGLLREIRYRILAVIGSAETKPHALAAIDRSDGDNVAIALCTLMNVGLVVLDGAGFLDVNGRTPEIFRFLLKLRQFTGIPILVSGTSAFMHSSSFFGNMSTNLFNGESLCIEKAKAPSVDAKKNSLRPGIWASMCKWLWRQTFRDVVMPPELPGWMYLCTNGRDAWLVQGFQSLAKYAIANKDCLNGDALTSEKVYSLVAQRLEVHLDAREAILNSDVSEAESGSPERALNQLSFLKHLDHMPTSMLKKGECKELIDALVLKRLGAAV